MIVSFGSAERAWLRQFLLSHFDFDELKDLAFDLGADYQLFSYEPKRKLARELIAHFERRGELKSLVNEVLRQRYDEDLAQLVAKLPTCSSRKKMQIIVSQDLLADVSGLIDDIAKDRFHGNFKYYLPVNPRHINTPPYTSRDARPTPKGLIILYTLYGFIK